jgi:RNA polymerase sigma-70 factor, ECF subfamily
MGSENSCADLAGGTLAAGEADVSSEVQRSARQQADQERLARLLREEFRNVWRALRRFGVAEDATDDATEEVFIILSRKLGEVPVGQERRYAMGVAMRVAANVRRTSAARHELAVGEALLTAVCNVPLSDALLDQKRMRELMDAVLDTMSADLRTAFVLFELEGFTVLEVAELLAVPTGTAASRLRRARESFHSTVARLKADSLIRDGEDR